MLFFQIDNLQIFRGRSIQNFAINIESGAMTRTIPRFFCFIPADISTHVRTRAFHGMQCSAVVAVNRNRISLVRDGFSTSK